MVGFCSSHGCVRYSMNISWIVCACEKKLYKKQDIQENTLAFYIWSGKIATG